MGRFCSIFPFSVSEVLIGISAVLLPVLAVRDVLRLIRRRHAGAGWFLRWLGTLLLICGTLWLVYMGAAGVNYSRRTFSELTEMDTSGGTADELYEVGLRMAAMVNVCASLVDRGEDGGFAVPDTLRADAVAAMGKLAETYACLSGYYPNPKPILTSELFSMQNITGIYSPFTAEANYNHRIPDYNLPYTICHELSHLRGFMREDEANFIGFLACIGSDSVSFQYSGYMLGYIYVSNALYRENAERWSEVRSLLCDEALYDLEQNTLYWEQYEGPAADAAETRNDSYLKFNHQTDGVQSYGRVVNLILAYYRGR